jgi:hypothetical protein
MALGARRAGDCDADWRWWRQRCCRKAGGPSQDVIPFGGGSLQLHEGAHSITVETAGRAFTTHAYTTHCTCTLYSCTALIHCSHTLFSHTALIHCTHTLHPYTTPIHFTRILSLQLWVDYGKKGGFVRAEVYQSTKISDLMAAVARRVDKSSGGTPPMPTGAVRLETGIQKAEWQSGKSSFFVGSGAAPVHQFCVCSAVCVVLCV